MDLADDAQARVELETEAAISAARSRLSGAGADDCVDCGAAIPAARRTAMPSATRCVDCQEMTERRGA